MHGDDQEQWKSSTPASPHKSVDGSLMLNSIPLDLVDLSIVAVSRIGIHVGYGEQIHTSYVIAQLHLQLLQIDLCFGCWGEVDIDNNVDGNVYFVPICVYIPFCVCVCVGFVSNEH